MPESVAPIIRMPVGPNPGFMKNLKQLDQETTDRPRIHNYTARLAADKFVGEDG